MAKRVMKFEGGWMIQCPACKSCHGFWTETPNPHTGARWRFDGNEEKPTFEPSMLATVKYTPRPPLVCHSFVRNGRIEFLGDCTHELAGKTVDLDPVDQW